MEIRIPYGKTVLRAQAGGCAVLESRAGGEAPALPGAELVRRAMEHPAGSPRLRTLAAGARSAVILISDHTRPVPSRDILPAMLSELREGNPAVAVTLLVATGCHRATGAAELEAKLGELAARERILIHDAFDPARNVRIGTLPSGAPLVIDRAAADAELLAAEGFIEPHFFAGFSGGRKSVLPGVCAAQTVLGNHCGGFIASPFARTGVLDGNPIHADMLSAARQANLRYIVNVVLNSEKKTAAAFAGDPEAAHRAGCEYLRARCGVKAAPADIVVTGNGGAPLDQNVYQCVKSLTAAEASAAPGAVLIECAECADGVGGDGFYRALRECASPAELYARCAAAPRDGTVPDQWQAQILARILAAHRVIFVTRPALRDAVTEMKMTWAPDLAAALSLARAEKGETASVTAIPDGVSVIVEP